MRKIIFILFFFSLFIGKTQGGERPRHTIMLVLGSDNLKILSHRIEVAHRLYRLQKFDRIIVSGGCAAHASSICEATEMHDQLVAKGVPSIRIYKEENSKTTVQNYIFSRELKDENGQLIIQPGDSVYVVSDHWHAISVAARLEKYDAVKARFYIEGNIQPKESDFLDYGRIFTGEENNDTFVLRGLWPTPDAVANLNGKRHYFFNDHVYVQDNDTTYRWIPLAVLLPNFPQSWYEGVDEVVEDNENQHWIFIKGDAYCILSFSNVQESVTPLALHEIVKGLPVSLSVEAAYIQEDRLYVLQGDKVWIARRTKGKKFQVEECVAVKEFFSAYPFNWGQSSPSAVYYDHQAKELSLFKNREILRIQDNKVREGYPKRLNLKWPIPKTQD